MVKIVLAMEEKALKYDESKRAHVEYSRNWALKNKERSVQNAKRYMDRHRVEVNEKAKLYQREKYRKIKEQKIAAKALLDGQLQISHLVTIL